ncbi:MAG TPA: ATP-binding protein [Ideonella sp.]|nr:ATP-binding protein [Ideonella sp.]
MTRVALLGAESTGKTQLSAELAAHLRSLGLRAVAVPEVLREWCLREDRTPRPEEQLAIAREQEQRVDQAAADGAIVIADTTALMVAIHAGMLFEDGELYRFALERQQGYDATLVTGLDLPWVPDGLQRDASQAREPVDALVRALLQRAQLAFQVVYGQGPQRLRSALQALRSTSVLPAEAAAGDAALDTRQAWVWVCDKCSDPACEHRLFTQLREGRG